MFGSIAASILQGVLGTVVTPLFNYLSKRQDTALEKFRVDTGMTRDAAIELLRTDAVVKNATKDVVLAAMTHPIWWVAWLFFVVPVAAYEGAIFFVSTFDSILNAPGCYIPEIGSVLRPGGHVCEHFVRRVPSEQEEIARIIVQSIFLAQVGTGATAGIVHAITTRLRPKV